MRKRGAERLHRWLERNQELARRIDDQGFPLARFEIVQQWQRRRIAHTFADFYADEGYRPAVEFFLSELYGGLHFRERDQDIAKVMPVMTHFLPDRALHTMSEAFELQAISLELDTAMARRMQAEKIDVLDTPAYCRLYRKPDERETRERQILLVRKLGRDLDKLVRKPLVNYLVRLLRGPAHAAGFGALQDFLESGLAAFRALEDPEYFIETIYEREWDAMERVFAGEADPFGLESCDVAG